MAIAQEDSGKERRVTGGNKIVVRRSEIHDPAKHPPTYYTKGLTFKRGRVQINQIRLAVDGPGESNRSGVLDRRRVVHNAPEVGGGKGQSYNWRLEKHRVPP